MNKVYVIISEELDTAWTGHNFSEELERMKFIETNEQLVENLIMVQSMVDASKCTVLEIERKTDDQMNDFENALRELVINLENTEVYQC